MLSMALACGPHSDTTTEHQQSLDSIWPVTQSPWHCIHYLLEGEGVTQVNMRWRL